MKTVVWDVDDVLNRLMHDWFVEAWLPGHPDCHVRYGQLRENPPERALGISRADYLASLDEFRLTRGARLQPRAEIVEWFLKYGDQCRHAALTAVPLCAAGMSAAWVMTHFGRWIRCFAVVPSARPDTPTFAYDTCKGDYLEWWGACDVMVDDKSVNIQDATALGIKGVLFPQPWNAQGKSVAEALTELTRLVNTD